MSDGEFKRRMKKVFADFDKESVDFLLQPFIDIVDEARKEFPIEEWKLRSKSTVSYEESAKVVEWFLRWFGEKK